MFISPRYLANIENKGQHPSLQIFFEELTPTLLREFVEKIVIHESEALDGKRRGKLRRQEIEIYYSFVGKVELPD